MDNDSHAKRPRSTRCWLSQDACSVNEFVSVVSQTTDRDACRTAEQIEQNVPIYDCRVIRTAAANEPTRRELLAEWANLLLFGPGVFVLKRAYADTEPIDRATTAFNEMIAEQRKNNKGSGDHFAKPGANDRIWNALEKLCVRDPQTFALYYANEFIALPSEAWLGPNYQITSQINAVNPGGDAQQAHRDYHLGFQTVDEAARYPVHVHCLSPMLTLQGAIAHCDMPVESGPTRLLPFSQVYEEGYMAWRRPDFQEVFAAHCVQIPLEKGDAIFFSPALFHAAGANRTNDVSRMANLLQISSAYGRAMETVNRHRMCLALYPALKKLTETDKLNRAARDCAIAACADGYSFPTNLDRDPPIGGLAPQTQQSLMREACDKGWSEQEFEAALIVHAKRRG